MLYGSSAHIYFGHNGEIKNGTTSTDEVPFKALNNVFVAYQGKSLSSLRI